MDLMKKIQNQIESRINLNCYAKWQWDVEIVGNHCMA